MLIRSHLRVWAVAILLTGATCLVSRADDKPAEKKAAEKNATEKKAAAAKGESDVEVMEKDDEETADGKGRLPTYFTRLGLTPDEKTKIQASMAKFDDSIKKAEAEVKKLHADRDTAAEKLLTSEQHKMLTKIREEAKAARAKKAEETPSKKKSKKEMEKMEKSDEKSDKK